jgi:hypothetical protein
MGRAIGLLRQDDRPLELAIHVDSRIAAVIEERVDEDGVPTLRSCPALTAVTATTACR